MKTESIYQEGSTTLPIENSIVTKTKGNTNCLSYCTPSTGESFIADFIVPRFIYFSWNISRLDPDNSRRLNNIKLVLGVAGEFVEGGSIVGALASVEASGAWLGSSWDYNLGCGDMIEGTSVAQVESVGGLLMIVDPLHIDSDYDLSVYDTEGLIAGMQTNLPPTSLDAATIHPVMLVRTLVGVHSTLIECINSVGAVPLDLQPKLGTAIGWGL